MNFPMRQRLRAAEVPNHVAQGAQPILNLPARARPWWPGSCVGGAGKSALALIPQPPSPVGDRRRGLSFIPSFSLPSPPKPKATPPERSGTPSAQRPPEAPKPLPRAEALCADHEPVRLVFLDGGEGDFLAELAHLRGEPGHAQDLGQA